MKKKILGLFMCALFACFMMPGMMANAATDPTPSPIAPTATPVSVSFKTAFPDGNFRGFVNEKVLTTKLTDSDVLTDEVKKELSDYTGDLDLTGQSISDLTGITYLNGIRTLTADNNSITTLVLKDFDNLESIKMSHNKLTTASLSGLPKLQEIDVDYNRLMVLDVSQIISLEKISCSANDIATLNIAKLAELTSLQANDNNLLSLDLSGNTKLVLLNVEDNNLATLDISKLTKLVAFYGDGNELVNFDISTFPANTFNNFELRKSSTRLTGVALGTQYGVILPANATEPVATSISNSGSYLSTTRSIVWSSLTKVPATFTYQYAIKGSTELVTVTVDVDKSTMVSDALTVATPTTFTSADYSYNKLKLSWSAVNGATGYRLYRSTSKTGTFSLVKTITSATKVSYINSGLSCGTTYYYKMRAYREVNGVMYFGSYTNVISRKAKPAKPTVTLSKYSSRKIKISWKQKAGASGYVIYRSTSKSGTYSKIKTITSGKTVKYINTKRKKGTRYYYKMRTYRTVNGTRVYSAYSSIKNKKL